MNEISYNKILPLDLNQHNLQFESLRPIDSKISNLRSIIFKAALAGGIGIALIFTWTVSPLAFAAASILSIALIVSYLAYKVLLNNNKEKLDESQQINERKGNVIINDNKIEFLIHKTTPQIIDEANSEHLAELSISDPILVHNRLANRDIEDLSGFAEALVIKNPSFLLTYIKLFKFDQTYKIHLIEKVAEKIPHAVLSKFTEFENLEEDGEIQKLFFHCMMHFAFFFEEAFFFFNQNLDRPIFNSKEGQEALYTMADALIKRPSGFLNLNFNQVVNHIKDPEKKTEFISLWNESLRVLKQAHSS